MSKTPESNESASSHVDHLDRLVDGELTNDEYRDLLIWLERQPDGWRRCALAFLEAQAWRKVMGEISNVPLPRDASEPLAMASGRALGRVITRERNVAHHLALAATVAIAFLAGHLLPSTWTSSTPLDRQSSIASSRHLNAVAGNESPVAAADQLDLHDERFWRGESALSDDILASLERSGVKVKQQIGYVPVMREDGQKVIVPVNQVQLIPTKLNPH